MNINKGVGKAHMTEVHSRITLDQPGTYEIQVQGLISKHWLESFKPMQINVIGDDGWAMTTLEGRVADQAALQGMLQQLYTLGLVLLSIKRKEG
jgi:hypothetical protein